jgi:hypothetical protein
VELLVVLKSGASTNKNVVIVILCGACILLCFDWSGTPVGGPTLTPFKPELWKWAAVASIGHPQAGTRVIDMPVLIAPGTPGLFHMVEIDCQKK